MKAARLGEQSGVVANALRKTAPSLARRSMLGVFTNGWPVQPSSSNRRSSIRMKTMFGRGGCASSVGRKNTEIRSAERLIISASLQPRRHEEREEVGGE